MTEPKCPYFSDCAGCSLQHIDYSTQLENKKNQVKHAVNLEEVSIFSDDEYHYRNRMDFLFCSRGLGLRKKSDKNEILFLENCVISSDRINLLLKEMNSFFKGVDFFDFRKGKGAFKSVIVRAPLSAPASGSSLAFILNGESSRIREAVEKIEEYSRKSTAGSIMVCYADPDSAEFSSEDIFVAKGSEMGCEELLGKKFFYRFGHEKHINHVSF